MNTSPEAVRIDDDTLWVSLSDGRTIAAPLTWFPRLLEATPEQRDFLVAATGSAAPDRAVRMGLLACVRLRREPSGAIAKVYAPSQRPAMFLSN